MANDPPTNQRMGFGFPQARAAGAPYVRPRPGYAMDWDINERRYEKELAAIVRRNPSIRAVVREKMETMKTGVYWLHRGSCFQLSQDLRSSATFLYYFVLYARPDLAPKGYWDRVRKKYGMESPPQSN
jgi:hypothetical protein